MQHHTNPIHPQNISGIHKKGISMGEEAMVQITAGLCANPESWQKTPQEIIQKAQSIHDELFRYKTMDDQ